MANRPFRECKHPHCRKLTRSIYCDEHSHMLVEEESSRQRYYDLYNRNRKTKSYYQSNTWKMLTAKVKSDANGLCQYCSTPQEPVIGTEADHVIPIDTVEGWEQRNNLSNLKWACHTCHMKKSAEDRKKYIGKRVVGRGG